MCVWGEGGRKEEKKGTDDMTRNGRFLEGTEGRGCVELRERRKSDGVSEGGKE